MPPPQRIRRAAGLLAELTVLAELTGLTGLAGDAEPGAGGIGSVAAAASATRYLIFSARSRWYRQVCWDIGIAALRPGSRTVATLAATDTD